MSIEAKPMQSDGQPNIDKCRVTAHILLQNILLKSEQMDVQTFWIELQNCYAFYIVHIFLRIIILSLKSIEQF